MLRGKKARRGPGRRMAPLACAAALLACLALLAACGARQTAVPADSTPAALLASYPALEGRAAEETTVERVIDGDTFETSDGHKVRLIGVNTPEIGDRPEPYGREAAAFTRDELQGRKVWMFADVSETDRYGRLLRYVFAEGTPVMFNERLVREGYARTMTIAPDVAFAELFAAVEREARAAGRGLWGAADDAGTDADAARDAAAKLPGTEAEAAAEAACGGPPVKGNINRKGDKIYHLSGAPSYDATKAEQYFCTAEEAQAAGFRAPG